MTGILNNKLRTAGKLSLTVTALLLTCQVHGQEKNMDRYDSIAAKYKNEHAVYTELKQQLVITAEDGKLVANSHYTLEKLFLSDLSLNNYNTDNFYFSSLHQLTDYSGFIYVPQGRKYKKITSNAFGAGRPHDYVFYDDNRVGQAYYSGVKKNALTETRYSIENADIHMLSPFLFQDFNLPVVHATFEIIAPNYVNMNFVLKGEHTDAIKQTKEEKNGRIIYTFTATDMPEVKEMDHVPSWRYYVPHVIPYITSYRITGAKKDSVISSNPDMLYKYQYGFIHDINMKHDTFLAKKVAELTKNATSQREKAANIYKWVQQNIHYIAIENGLEGFIPRPADTVFKRNYGDCKDMTSILVTMCRLAKLDAYYTWVGSDELPYTNAETPLICVNNHMICALKINEEWLFLDATNPVQPLGANRDDLQGKEAMIAINEKTYKIVTIPEVAADNNVITDSTYLKLGDGVVTGSVLQQHKGYPAWNIAYMNMHTSREEDRAKAVKAITARGSDRYIQNKYDIAVADIPAKDATIRADFTINNYAQVTGKQCFVNMNLCRTFENKRIDTKDRTVPSYTDYKSKKKEVVVLEIPKGYKVSYLPKPAKGSVPGLWSYNISYKADKNKITLTKEYEVNTRSIASAKFADNNKMVDDLRKIYKESVVLTAN